MLTRREFLTTEFLGKTRTWAPNFSRDFSTFEYSLLLIFQDFFKFLFLDSTIMGVLISKFFLLSDVGEVVELC